MDETENRPEPWTWRNWIAAKAEMEHQCSMRELEARRQVLDAEGEARRAQEELSRYGWYDKHRDMLERVAEDAARLATQQMAERIESVVEDVLDAIRDRLSSRD